MLTLPRKTAESIHIGTEVIITVIRFHPYKNEVHLGIKAPPHIPIYPAELDKTEAKIWQAAANDA